MPNIAQNMPRYDQNMPKICSIYAQDMLNMWPNYAQYIPAMSTKDMTKYPPDMPKICLRYGPNMHNMNQLQMFQKVGYGGGPIFKVVLEC